MQRRWLAWAAVGLLLLSTCGGAEVADAKRGRLRIVVTVDWEGAFISPESQAALRELREALPTLPLTHFICPAYFTKPKPAPELAETIRAAVLPVDRVGVHLHPWKSLVTSAGVAPKFGPSYLRRDGELYEFDDGDVGFGVEIGAYTTDELRSIVRVSRELLERAGLEVAPIFRGGAGIIDEHVLEALAAEGIRVDASLIQAPYWRVEHGAPALIGERTRETWGDVDLFAPPFLIATNEGRLLEVPGAPGFADYGAAKDFIEYIDEAAERLRARPNRDVYVHLGLHQETAHIRDEVAPHRYVDRVRRAVEHAMSKYPELVVFDTIVDVRASSNVAVNGMRASSVRSRGSRAGVPQSAATDRRR